MLQMLIKVCMYNVLTIESAICKKKGPFPNLYLLCSAFSFFLFPFSSRYKHTHIAFFIGSVYIWESRQEMHRPRDRSTELSSHISHGPIRRGRNRERGQQMDMLNDAHAPIQSEPSVEVPLASKPAPTHSCRTSPLP
jgi:hypothetical protein